MSLKSNTPEVKLAIVGVSRDCFPIQLTQKRLAVLVDACKKIGMDVFACRTIIENEKDTLAALAQAEDAGANAAVVYLGNFGPEGPLSIFAQRFNGPVMTVAAAEESQNDLINGRGDAFCGLLNASYNFALRNVRVHIPENPVGLADQLAGEIAHFRNVAKLLIGLANLKIFAFGPRPQDFYACNAPIQGLYKLGVEVMENSELDMLQLVDKIKENDPDVKRLAQEMEAELGQGNTYPDLLPKLARFELALRRFVDENLGSRQYAAFANKCWPAFESAFGFVPCYVNSRLAADGIPAACEVDIYGALSEYICTLATNLPATLLDINNTVPDDMIDSKSDLKGACKQDLFMGFHCGNTPSCCMKQCTMKYQLIMNRLIEDPQCPPNITRGTLEGQLKPGPITLFRLQGRAEGGLESYIAQGNCLDIDPRSFGGIGIIGVPNFARFYRHVLIEKHFPHHAAVGFSQCGKTLFDALKLLGIENIHTPLPAGVLYKTENPF
jgi:L-fucose isomerase-like protein